MVDGLTVEEKIEVTNGMLKDAYKAIHREVIWHQTLINYKEKEQYKVVNDCLRYDKALKDVEESLYRVRIRIDSLEAVVGTCKEYLKKLGDEGCE